MGRDVDTRGVSPVVSKTLEIGLVVLYLGVVSTAIYGGAVPEYRTLAGAEVAERTAAGAAQDIAHAVPATPVASVTVERSIAIPTTIRGSTYVVEADGRALVLRHPDPDIGVRVPLVLPDSVSRVTGEWRSSETAVISVTGGRDEIRVKLTTRAER